MKNGSIFKKYRKFMLVYIDDILVFSQTHEDHYDHLSIVFFGGATTFAQRVQHPERY